jgi:hypothetical protein
MYKDFSKKRSLHLQGTQAKQGIRFPEHVHNYMLNHKI